MSNVIKQISVGQLFDKMGVTHEDMMRMNWKEESKLVIDWCEENNYHYYAAPKEDFFAWEGIQEAEDKGCVGVVLENLS